MPNLIHPALHGRSYSKMSWSDLSSTYLVGDAAESDYAFLPLTTVGIILSAISFIDTLTPYLQFVSVSLSVLSLIAGFYLIYTRIRYRKLSIIQKRMEIDAAISKEAKEVRKEIAREAVKRLSVEEISEHRDRMKQMGG